MTVEPYGAGAPTPWTADDLDDMGLGDVSATDIRMPRLVIDHETAQFKNTTSGEMFPELRIIFLGLVKQRIMWDSVVDEGDKPQCKSPNHEIGYPQMRTDIPTRKQFPWDRSNFNKDDFPPNEAGLVALPCNTCTLKDWGKERGDRPACSEQATFPVYYELADGGWAPAIISFQKSGIKAALTYAASFAGRRKPMFTAITKVTLTPESRGKTRYATPGFQTVGASDHGNWAEYKDTYRQVRTFLHEPPRALDNDGKGKPVASSVAATVVDDDDPWATSAPATSAPAAPASSADNDLPF